MRSAYFVEKNKMEVREFPKAQLVKETDAIIKIVRACVCGSDLWWFRGISERQPGPVGHEAIGVIEEGGAGVKNFKAGDLSLFPLLMVVDTVQSVWQDLKLIAPMLKMELTGDIKENSIEQLMLMVHLLKFQEDQVIIQKNSWLR